MSKLKYGVGQIVQFVCFRQTDAHFTWGTVEDGVIRDGGQQYLILGGNGLVYVKWDHELSDPKKTWR
jgi:hypothetical protein